MAYTDTVLIIPPNDAEALMIVRLAEAMGLAMIKSTQLHGASLDKGHHDYYKEVKAGGFKKVVVVEMPGPKTEAKLRKLGVELVIIDHHHYTGLDRAHDPKTGKMLPSSLEQFLKLFTLTDAKLKKLGFDPRMVKGIGIQDRGYIWALYDEGYSKSEVKKVIHLMDELTAPLKNDATEARKQRTAYNAWKRKTTWREFFVIVSSAATQLRPRLSRIVVDEIGKPTSLIIVERSRRLIYVQESPYAMALFNEFGGFTFGLDRNWGHRNDKGGKQVTLKDVKRVIEREASK